MLKNISRNKPAKEKTMKKIFFISVLVYTFSSLVFTQTAEEIIKSAKTQMNISSMGTRAKMQIQNAGKTLSVLVIDQYSSKDKNGLQRTFIEFKEPANARGTRFLMLEQKNGMMDQRIFLPALGKVRRISAGAEDNESFMGTDFSYSDISFITRDTDLDTFKMLKEETLDGKKCNVIEAVSKDGNYPYSKTLIWAEKGNNLFWKAEFYDKKGQPVKIIELSGYKKIQNIMTPTITKLTTVAAGTSTIIELEKIKYNMNIPERVFTTRYLETGK